MKSRPKVSLVLAHAVDLAEAERKAWDSLARYKFMMFAYWAAIWIHLSRMDGVRRPNPWSALVKAAREHMKEAYP